MSSLARSFAPVHAGRRASFPLRSTAAWIDSAHGIPFPAIVTPRVRDGLVLRPVEKQAPGRSRNAFDAHGCR
jgi:hypothetical protein